MIISPPTGKALRIELVAKVKTGSPLSGPGIANQFVDHSLVRIEVESGEGVASFPPRMGRYHHMQLRLNHPESPVLSIALYLRVGRNGVGEEGFLGSHGDDPTISVTYRYVGLPALDAEIYIDQDNWLGLSLATLMRMPQWGRHELTLEAWRRLLQCPQNDYRKHLLLDCLIAYYSTEEDERTEFIKQAMNCPETEEQKMASTLFKFVENIGHEKELQEGRHVSRRETLIKLLEVRFG
ncbi:MAG: hypothetical protein ACFCD0_15540 [Gemmataceae bacterium]